MNTQTHPHRSRPMGLLSLATVVSCVALAAHRARAESLIIPSEFANREGSSVMGIGNPGPFRVHFLYLGSEFPQEPIDIIGVRFRPKSTTATQTAVNRDVQLNLTTTNEAVLNTDFGVNLDMALQPPTRVITGNVQISTIRPNPNQSPRTFDYEFSWASPFRFNPADGANLLLDYRASGYNNPPLYDAINSPTERPNTPRMVLEEQSFGRGYHPAFWVTQFLYYQAGMTPTYHSWDIDSDGAWAAGRTWDRGVPNRAGVHAVLGGAITSARTVTVNTPITVGRIDFDSINSYTIAGPQILTLDATSGDAQINVASGSHTISAPFRLLDNTTITVTPEASNLALTGPFVGQNVTKAGEGTLTMNYVRATSLSVNSGTVTIAPVGIPAVTSMVGSLSIAGEATPTAKLDLNNNAAIINYAEASPAATVRQQILAGRGVAGFGATWTGMGVTSSAAAAAVATEAESRSIGYAENATMPLGSYSDFRGQPVDDTSILMAFTRTGDANLDGLVNDDDVTIIGAFYAPGVANANWAFGDFDYNGFVDDVDVTLLGAFYDPSAPPLAAPGASVAAVPEPGTVALLLSGLIGTLMAAVVMRRKSR